MSEPNLLSTGGYFETYVSDPNKFDFFVTTRLMYHSKHLLVQSQQKKH